MANLLIQVIFINSLVAQTQQQENRAVGNKSGNAKKLALVIGNADYQFTDELKNPVNDASDMTETLKKLDFEVLSGINQSKQGMQSLIRQFGIRLAETKGVGVFYYAGHGISSGGTNYLIPVNADIQAEDEIEDASVSINFILNKMAAANNSFNMVILDACRNNPFARSWNRSRDTSNKGGLSKIEAPTGTLIAYATKPGEVSLDGTGRNGLYTGALLKRINIKNIEVTKMFQLVRADVIAETNGKQVPFDESTVVGDFYFAGSDGSKADITIINQPKIENDKQSSNPPERVATLDIVTAQAILERAVQAKDGSMQGQVEAIESLLTRDFNFISNNLSGVSLRGANLSKGKFQKARLHMTDLSEVNAENIDLSESRLRFANLEKARFARADLSKSYAAFVWGRAANFEKAKLNKVNFFSSDLREADFSGADLSEVSFAFADLRGAKFDGADLTGAYFVGAILDQATFNNAILKETNFTGASADNFLLNEKQKEGACRHYVLDERRERDWVVELYEEGKNDSFTASVWFEEKGWFASFQDRTLPLCTTAEVKNTVDGFNNAIVLDKAVAKADRKKLFENRLKEHIKLLTANLTITRVLKGDNKQRKAWDDYMQNAVKLTKPVSKSYYNTDLLIQILLKENLITPEKISWGWQAKKVYELEEFIRKNRKGNFAEYMMWQSIFPPDAAWDDLPDNRVELYKNWSLARASKAPRQLVVKEAIVVPEKSDANTFVVPLAALRFTKDKCCSSQSGQIGINPDSAASPEVYFWNNDQEEILFVFPERLDNLLIDLPVKFKSETNLVVEVDLNLEKTVKFEGKDWYKKPFVSNRLFVEPDSVRLFKDGKLLWNGKIQKNDVAIEKEVWEKIKGSRNRQDFDAFLKSFPTGIFAGEAQVKREQIVWDSIRINCDKKKLLDFLTEFPNGANSVTAKSKIKQIIDFTTSLPANLTPGTIIRKNLPNGGEICFSWIPPGNFMMGASEADVVEASKEMSRIPNSPRDNRDQFQNETPQRKVTLKSGFWMGKYEVTQGQWKAVMKSAPQTYHSNCGDDCPVEAVTWDEAKEFIEKLNLLEDKFQYSLPSEAEWEYAARAGTTTAFAFGNTLSSLQANFEGVYGDVKEAVDDSANPSQRWRRLEGGIYSQPIPVGIYQPNSWGIYDMHGNVSEWVEDAYNITFNGLKNDGSAILAGDYGSTEFKVIRGGAYNDKGFRVRSTSRGVRLASQQGMGFRVVARLK